MKSWWIFHGTGRRENVSPFPEPPPWRRFGGTPIPDRTLLPDSEYVRRFGTADGHYHAKDDELDVVNAAILLRRPLLLTGKPGVGKSSLAYAIAHELELGPVLRWSITSRSTLNDGLYRYDALGRLEAATLARGRSQRQVSPADPATSADDVTDREPLVGEYITLGPLGTALLPTELPRVLLIDELDKSDIDLPNDLLHVFEEGRFEIPELTRHRERDVRVRPHDGDDRVNVVEGTIVCRAFPIVVLTSNQEREFPTPFLRRCLRLEKEQLDRNQLAGLVEGHFRPGPETLASGADVGAAEQRPSVSSSQRDDLIMRFIASGGGEGRIAPDQLLNAVAMLSNGIDVLDGTLDGLRDTLLRSLTSRDLE